MTQHILATQTHLLPADWWNSGCYQHTEFELMDIVKQAGVWLGPRPVLETTPAFRQIIPYVVMVDRAPNELGARFLSYRRSSKGGETRLHDKCSIGLGGHVSVDDVLAAGEGDIHLRFTLEQAAEREVIEELGVYPNPIHRQWACALVNNADEVGKVHLGLVWLWLLQPNFVPPTDAGDGELTSISYQTRDELLKLDTLEPWSALFLNWKGVS